MSGIATAVVGGAVIGGMLSADAQESSANTAAGAQMGAARLQTEEARRQFDQIQQLLSPYVSAGNSALAQQMNLLGLNGSDAQGTAVNGIANSQQMQALTDQGENAIRQNASATGGLRGGNTQAALAQFRPQLLNQLIQQQYSQLGGITQTGLGAATGTGNAAANSSNQVISALGQSGAAQAGAALASGQAQAQMYNGITQTGSTLGTLALMGKF